VKELARVGRLWVSSQAAVLQAKALISDLKGSHRLKERLCVWSLSSQLHPHSDPQHTIQEGGSYRGALQQPMLNLTPSQTAKKLKPKGVIEALMLA